MDVPISFENLAAAVVHPATNVAIDGRFIGYLVRTDQWGRADWPDPWHLLYLIHEGECEIQTTAGSHRAAPGQAICFYAPRIARIQFSPTLRYTEVRFACTQSAGRKTFVLDPSVVVLDPAADLALPADHIAGEIRLQRADQSLLVRHWLGLLLATCHRLHRTPSRDQPALTVAQRNLMVRFVQRHMHEPITPADLAKVVSLSPDYFSRVFRSDFGQSPRDWIIRQRMFAACRLLRDGTDPIERISEQMGYACVAHFCRQFKRTVGSTPLSYRRGRGA